MTADADIEAFRAQDRCPLHGLMESQGLDLPEAFRISFGEFCYMPILHEQSPRVTPPKEQAFPTQRVCRYTLQRPSDHLGSLVKTPSCGTNSERELGFPRGEDRKVARTILFEAALGVIGLLHEHRCRGTEGAISPIPFSVDRDRRHDNNVGLRLVDLRNRL